MRHFILLLSALALGACAHVGAQTAYSARSPRGVVVYESIGDVDLIVRKVDLASGRAIGGLIMLPATHRINSVTISRDQIRLGYKELDPGTYAIVSAYTGMTASITGPGGGACRDGDAIVVAVKPGEIGVLPRSYYRLRDARAGGRTGLGEEAASLANARTVVAAYPNIDAPVQLLDIVGAIRFAPRTSLGLVRDSCASAESFEVLTRN